MLRTATRQQAQKISYVASEESEEAHSGFVPSFQHRHHFRRLTGEVLGMVSKADTLHSGFGGLECTGDEIAAA